MKFPMKFKFQCPEIKFYGNTATPIHFPIIHGCFHAITAELSGCNTGHKAHKAYQKGLSGPLPKKFADLCLPKYLHTPVGKMF